MELGLDLKLRSWSWNWSWNLRSRNWSWSWNLRSWSWSWYSGDLPELELELELKPPELELELIFWRLAGVGVGVETSGVGVGVDIKELTPTLYTASEQLFFFNVHSHIRGTLLLNYSTIVTKPKSVSVVSVGMCPLLTLFPQLTYYHSQGRECSGYLLWQCLSKFRQTRCTWNQMQHFISNLCNRNSASCWTNKALNSTFYQLLMHASSSLFTASTDYKSASALAGVTLKIDWSTGVRWAAKPHEKEREPVSFWGGVSERKRYTTLA